MEAYKAGIDAEGNGGSEAMKKGYETAKRKVQEEAELDDDDDVSPDIDGTARAAPSSAGPGAGGMPDLAGLASMLGGGAGGAGGGGMPDLSSIMQNPMMRQMAQNLMSNPDALNSIMSNPRLREMANGFGGGAGGQGGGMPNLSEMMNDPAIAEM
jgi:small glutamine-rich tetratricopeptide repeat-containing protein alpha